MSSFNIDDLRSQIAQVEARAQAAEERAQAANELAQDALAKAQAALEREKSAQEWAKLAEAEVNILRDAAGRERLSSSSSAEADSIPAELSFPSRPIRSPTGTGASCFLEDPFVALVAEPASIPVDATLSDAFKNLLKVAGSARRMGQERIFYPLATSILPSFAQAVGQPLGDITAEALFSPLALATPVWSFPPGCKPELHARSAAGSGLNPHQKALYPAFNGELKSAGDGRALEQAALYTILDLVRVFFPSETANSAVDACNASAKSAATQQRLFYSRPPLGYALVSYPYIAQVMLVECLGKMLVSPFSQPFLLGSQQHINVMATLPQPHFEEPVVLDLTIVRPWRTMPGVRAEFTSWCTMGGVFRKLVRGDARSGMSFAAMYGAYARLAEVLPHAPSHLHLPTSLRLLFGIHCLLVEMVPVVVGHEARDETELRRFGSPLLLSVAHAIAWLAMQRVIYTDLRAPNVILDKDRKAWLVDFDDCVVVSEPVRSVAAFKKAISGFPCAEELGTFAASLCAGAESAFEAALAQAFEEAAAAGGIACLAP